MSIEKRMGIEGIEAVKLHQHAQDRLIERGATESEVIATNIQGEILCYKTNTHAHNGRHER